MKMAETISVTWITPDGSRLTYDVPVGHTLMAGAVSHSVPGILGDCGGALACATCHVFVDHAPAALPIPKTTEAEMLEFAEVPPQQSSRLSCQLQATRELDGLVLRIPAA